ncbi:MAG: endonuclease/exonuclease/phosphatase family protein [Xanthomonadales bacterium]|nr:endonuclease/exonuclease/phosphatase family protein [Xanthomonadales bacterium]MDH4019598.1 endonuclease/exonuclease/phosphatase family protein [Xanthomonadales bacterium]
MRTAQFLFLLLFNLILSLPAQAIDDGNQNIRFATFNIAMGLQSEGELYQRLMSGDDEALRKVAAVIQKVRPDVLLLNEFDYFELDSAVLFIKNYLEIPQFGNDPISFPHALNGAVNTGLNSGLDLNGNGIPGEPGDAWGFGKFPGQYGMMILSRFQLSLERSFRMFKWIDMPGALLPLNTDGSSWYPEEISKELRLSSKSHWDIKLDIDGQTIHFLVSHPTPPVFDGPEDRNGARNYDEIRLWADYIDSRQSGYIYDDAGVEGGLPDGSKFVIAGDLNADPDDGDSSGKAIMQLLGHPKINASCVPLSEGAEEASREQGGKNLEHSGNPAADTGDFNDEYTGNMRIDYVLPSKTLTVTACGVFWPASDQPGHDLSDVSDHHLVWLDIEL